MQEAISALRSRTEEVSRVAAVEDVGDDDNGKVDDGSAAAGTLLQLYPVKPLSDARGSNSMGGGR